MDCHFKFRAYRHPCLAIHQLVDFQGDVVSWDYGYIFLCLQNEYCRQFC